MPNISKIKPTDGITYNISGSGGGGSSPSPSSATPLMDGTAAVGTSTDYARGDHRHPTDTSRAPTNHASTATTYGTGSGSDYGHVKLSDSISSTSSASGGTAATPKAVKDALDEAKTYADGVAGGITNITGTAPIQVTGSGNSRNVSIDAASSSAPGYMSASDKAALDNLVSNAATKQYVDAADALKQDLLVSGTNIKTINNQSILGSGNINISGGGGAVTLPIGTVYESIYSTNPSAALGDTWEFIGTSEIVGLELVTDNGDLFITSDGDTIGVATRTYKFVRTA